MSQRDARARRLRAVLGFLRLPDIEPELQLIHRWLDTWAGVGLVVAALSHQGLQVSLGDHRAGRWIAVFYQGGGGHEPLTAAGTAQEAAPWRAVQIAAWDTLDEAQRRG